MENEELQETNLTLYIEELKSDDPNLKLNASAKVVLISKVLGPARTRDELIPELIEIIEESDNEDEFLLKLIEQIIKLKDFIGGNNFLHCLIDPLEILAGAEENSIKSKAIEAIFAISIGQPKSFYSEHLFHLAKKMAQNEDNYSAKISSCQLISHCYPQLSQNEKQEIRQLESKLARDDSPMVKRAVANQIITMCKLLQKEEIRGEILPIWIELIDDEVDSVKLKTMESTAGLLLTNNELETIIFPHFKNHIAEKFTWRIREGVAEHLSLFISALETEQLKKELIGCFDLLLKDPEHEVRSITVQKIAEFSEKITENQTISTIIPYLTTLSKDSSQHVRHSVTQILGKIASHLEEKNIVAEIIPIMQGLIKDEHLDVRISLIDNFALLQQFLKKEDIIKSVVPLIQEMGKDKNWRFRLLIVKHLPKLFMITPEEVLRDCFLGLCTEFLNDHTEAIREQMMQNTLQIIEKFGYAKIKDFVLANITSLSKSTNYLERIASMQMINIIFQKIPQEDINGLFMQVVCNLSEDKIPNVKFNSIKCYITIKNALGKESSDKYKIVLNRLSNDKDVDVAFFAKKAIDGQ